MQVHPVTAFPWATRLLLLVPPLVPGTLSTFGATVGADRGLVACAWLAWTVATLGAWLPHPIGLTAARCALPVLVALCAAVADGSTASIAGATAAVLAAMLSASAHFGQHFVQAGAYGDERRWLLRLPAPLVLPTLIGWLVLVAPVVGAFALGGAGSAVGAHMARSMVEQQSTTTTKTVQVCQPVTSVREQVRDYAVRYEWDGREYVVNLPQHAGGWLKVTTSHSVQAM